MFTVYNIPINPYYKQAYQFFKAIHKFKKKMKKLKKKQSQELSIWLKEFKFERLCDYRIIHWILYDGNAWYDWTMRCTNLYNPIAHKKICKRCRNHALHDLLQLEWIIDWILSIDPLAHEKPSEPSWTCTNKSRKRKIERKPS